MHLECRLLLIALSGDHLLSAPDSGNKGQGLVRLVSGAEAKVARLPTILSELQCRSEKPYFFSSVILAVSDYVTKLSVITSYEVIYSVPRITVVFISFPKPLLYMPISEPPYNMPGLIGAAVMVTTMLISTTTGESLSEFHVSPFGRPVCTRFAKGAVSTPCFSIKFYGR